MQKHVEHDSLSANPARRQVLIETEEAAKRLARVILSDIEIYNPGKAPGELKRELQEGYVLYKSRVAPALLPLFSEVVAERWSAARGDGGGAASATPAPAAARSGAFTADSTIVDSSPLGAMRPPAASVTAAAPTTPPPIPLEARMARSAVATPTPVEPAPTATSERKPQLEPRDAARRLARVMVASIKRYNRDDAGAGLAAEIEEVRALFDSCVLPELTPLFQEALADKGLVEELHEQSRYPVAGSTPLPWEERSVVPEPATSDEKTDRTVAPDLQRAREQPPAPVFAPPAPPAAPPALESDAPASSELLPPPALVSPVDQRLPARWALLAQRFWNLPPKVRRAAVATAIAVLAATVYLIGFF